ncbi:MAG: DUF975 family protein [Lachnospiraceae bacterium]|nr:DUF975 family protein [Lachnospiraceae bacterium]
MWTRAELKDKAKVAFARSRWGLILCCLIMSLVSGGSGGGVGSRYSSSGNNSGDSDAYSNALNMFGLGGDIDPTEAAVIAGTLLGIVAVVFVVALVLSIFVFNPLSVGCTRYCLEASYEARTVGQLGIIGFAFKKGRYGNVVKTVFLMNLYICLWTILFIIPGIIKSYEYRMVCSILAENPELSSKEVFALSKEMMTGNKWAAFVLDLSFLGWIILGALTCGILLIFYVNPYIIMTDMYLYNTLKKRASKDYFDRTLEPAVAGYGYGGAADTYEYTPAPEAPLPEGSDTTSTSGWMPVYKPGGSDDSNSQDDSAE